jgi:16S rRNA (cytosine1402-N4)-methyltransferase
VNVINVVPLPIPMPPPDVAEPHASVMLEELISALSPREGGLYVDCTLGAGGHTEAILEVPGTRVIGLDRDQRAIRIASARLARFGDRFVAKKARFSEVASVLGALGVERIDGMIADVGVSSIQLDDATRGMSFRREGPLDMRMDESEGETALELIERLSDDELADLIYRYGEERRSRRVARCIQQAREAGELETTLDLRRAIIRAVGPARVGGVDPATRTFQALRIAVNRELEELTGLLEAAHELLCPGGVLAILSFHSLEDRLVKRAFRDGEGWTPLFKKPRVPSDEEMARNPRARSAKLRAAYANEAVGPMEPLA